MSRTCSTFLFSAESYSVAHKDRGSTWTFRAPAEGHPGCFQLRPPRAHVLQSRAGLCADPSFPLLWVKKSRSAAAGLCAEGLLSRTGAAETPPDALRGGERVCRGLWWGLRGPGSTAGTSGRSSDWASRMGRDAELREVICTRAAALAGSGSGQQGVTAPPLRGRAAMGAAGQMARPPGGPVPLPCGAPGSLPGCNQGW